MKRMKSMTAAFLGGLVTIGLAFSPSDSRALTVGFDGAASADPLVIDGFAFSPARVVSGNCLSGECLAFSKNETTTMTLDGGGTFNLDQIWFQFIGASSDEFTITSSTPGVSVTLTQDVFGNNDGGQFVSFTEFQGVESVTFTMGDSGNLRIDDITAFVPLPATIWLGAATLIGFVGLGAVGGRARRA